MRLGVDADSQEIVTMELTPDDVRDVSTVSDLLAQIEGAVSSMTGDGAYDGQSVFAAVPKLHPDAAVIIPAISGRSERECGNATR
jgi:hypothetical protein